MAHHRSGPLYGQATRPFCAESAAVVVADINARGVDETVRTPAYREIGRMTPAGAPAPRVNVQSSSRLTSPPPRLAPVTSSSR